VHGRIPELELRERLDELARAHHDLVVVFIDHEARDAVGGEHRVQREADRGLEGLRAVKVGDGKVDEHLGHEGLPFGGERWMAVVLA
jgi:hypothetical protein